ncbi:MAG TPA: enolase C-terminal domain-like protein [Solirubrobacteraceae bacterium]|nr:enolase C-terminal domain-like protein [Solirubrobacteraceae bacterium]
MTGSTMAAVAVERLEVSAYTVPTDAPESDGTLAWDATTMVVVEAHAGDATGLGYTYGDVAVARFVASKLADVVHGADALAPAATWARMQAAIRNAGRPGVGAMAVSAVDVALWDLKARLLDLPLVDILARFHDAVPIYGSGGFTSYGDEQLARQLAGWTDSGIPRVKIKVGREPEHDAHRVRVARDAIGEEVELLVDANGAYDRKQALLWAERFADAGVTWLEEPVSSEDREGLRLLRDHGPPGVDIAAGEYAWTLSEVADLAGCVDVVQADVTRVGGITALLRVDGICRGRSLPFSGHCAPALSAHALCALESTVHLEYFHDHVRIEPLLLDGTLDPDGGRLRPDRARPGHGLELKRADARDYEV